MVTPISSAMPVETRPIEIDSRHAHSICESTSLPSASVPSSTTRSPTGRPRVASAASASLVSGGSA